jgi:phosphomannomutase
VFGGEHSGHFYFRDFWRADSGMLAALHAIAALGETAPGTTLSQLLAEYDRYPMSGEINTTVDDQSAAVQRIKDAYLARTDLGELAVDELDGMTISGVDWWFNVRPSNTEPLLRLNVEAADEATMAAIRDDVLAIMRGAV